MKAKYRWLITALLITATAFAVVAMVMRPEDVPQQWQTALVEKGDILVEVSATGTLDARKTVDVGTQVSGRIEQILVDYNQQVKKGQVLAILDTTTLFATLQDVNTTIEKAEIQLKQAQWEYDRSYKLIEAEVISEQEFQQAEVNFEVALNELRSARTAYAKARQNLDYAIIKSPVDGVVISLEVEEGQTVAASYTTPTLFVLAEDLSKMKLEAKIDEADIGRIKNGQRVTFAVDAFPEDRFEEQVKQIRVQPTVSNNVTQYDVIIDVQNPDKRLLPGMTANLSIIVEERKGVWRMPNSALYFTPPASAILPETPSVNSDPSASASGRIVSVWVPSVQQKLRKEVVEAGLSNNVYTEVKWIGEPFARVVTGMEKEAAPGVGGGLFPGPPRGERRPQPL